MKIISFGSDKKIFEPGSGVRQRMIEYGRLVEELHVVLFCGRGFKEEKISENVWVHPTDSPNRWFFVCDGVNLAKKIIQAGGEWSISCRDPFEAGLAGWILKRETGFTLLVQVHTDFSSLFFKNSCLNWLRAQIAKLVLPRADRIRVVSGRIKKSLAGFKLNSEPTVLPVFIDAERFKAATPKFDLHQKYPQFDFIILMASRLTEEKNICLALEALAQTKKEFSKTGLVIVGEGCQKKCLKKKAERLNLKENVIFEPWSDDLASYYKTADLFLLTSDFEGYSLAVVEAAVSGCPVIMTDTGCAGEVIKNGENGVIVPVGDRKVLVEALIKIRREPALAENFRRNNLNINLPGKEEYLARYGKFLNG